MFVHHTAHFAHYAKNTRLCSWNKFLNVSLTHIFNFNPREVKHSLSSSVFKLSLSIWYFWSIKTNIFISSLQTYIYFCCTLCVPMCEREREKIGVKEKEREREREREVNERAAFFRDVLFCDSHYSSVHVMFRKQTLPAVRLSPTQGVWHDSSAV